MSSLHPKSIPDLLFQQPSLLFFLLSFRDFDALRCFVAWFVAKLQIFEFYNNYMINNSLLTVHCLCCIAYFYLFYTPTQLVQTLSLAVFLQLSSYLPLSSHFFLWFQLRVMSSYAPLVSKQMYFYFLWKK